MDQTKAIRVLLSIMLSIGIWLLFFLLLYVLAVYEYAPLVLLMGLILGATADVIYNILKKIEKDKRR